MFPMRRRNFILGSSAFLVLGAGRKSLAQPAPALTPHEKELYEAAKKEGGELTWYTAQSDDITAQALGRSFESIYPGLKVNVLRTTAQVAYQRVTQEIKASAIQCDVFSSTDLGHSVDAPDLVGRVRQISPQIDRATQLGHVRISLTSNPSLKVGLFARANIDAKRSCGVAVPRTAIDHLTVQVVKGNTVETRRVRVGLVSDTSIEILEGLDVGEIVVADAGSSLHDGDQIKTMFAEDLDRTRVR